MPKAAAIARVQIPCLSLFFMQVIRARAGPFGIHTSMVASAKLEGRAANHIWSFDRLWSGTWLVSQIHRRRLAFLNCDLATAVFRKGIGRFPYRHCGHAVSSRRQPLDSVLPALLNCRRLPS